MEYVIEIEGLGGESGHQGALVLPAANPDEAAARAAEVIKTISRDMRSREPFAVFVRTKYRINKDRFRIKKIYPFPEFRKRHE